MDVLTRNIIVFIVSLHTMCIMRREHLTSQFDCALQK